MFLLIVSIFYPFLLPDFFLGRSIGVSDASISSTSYSTSLFKRALRPGKANTGSLIKDFLLFLKKNERAEERSYDKKVYIKYFKLMTLGYG